MSVRRIGVLTSGGDAPGMNPCVRAVVRTALYHGLECYGIRRGWNGLINGDIVRLDEKSVAHTINRGGTILYTARSSEFMTEEGQRKAVSTCKFLGLDSIIAIGGDGTFRGALALSKYGINVIGIPGTIDNDISCTNYCIGFDTAANTAIECIDKLRDTMQSHERCSVVEVMGRNAGYLAMYVGLACGATAVLVPEEPIDFEKDVIEKIRQARFNGFTHYMIVVAEGAGKATEIAARIKEAIDLDPRVTVLGHIQRGGSPSARDRETAFLSRLYTTPMTALDFILGYLVPILPIALAQSAICYGFAAILGLRLTVNVLYALVLMLPAALFFISVGLLCGSVMNVKQVGGICGALFTNLTAWLSGTWFDLELVGGAFKKIAYALPFVHAVELERAAVSGSFAGILPHLLWVLGYAAAVTALAVCLFLRQMKRQ